MNDLQIFGFEDREFRVIMENGEPWFVAKDVAEALGYVWNGTQRIEHVPEEWRRVTSVVTRRGDKQDMAVLSEHGLYFFLGRSDKEAALPFQKLIAGKVLPTLRKTGTYTLPGREEKPAKEIPASRMKEIRMGYKDGIMSVNEYRKKAFNLPPFEIDAPLEVRKNTKPNRIRETEEPARPSDQLIKFVDNNLEFTGNSENYVPLPDLYERYIQQVENPLSRWTFIHTLRGSFNLISRQKRISGYPTLCFIGCICKTKN